MGRPLGTDGVNDLKDEAGAVLKAAAVGVGALVGEGGEEFVEEIAVGGVNFNEIESGFEGSGGGLAEGFNEGVDSGLIERAGNGVGGGKRDGARRIGQPATVLRLEEAFAGEGDGHAAFSTGVGELDADACALGVGEGGDAGEGGDVFVLPDAEVANGDAAIGGDGGGFNHDEASAALGACAEVDEMPVSGEAVLRGVLAHGRDADAIGENHGAELEGREERMAHGGLDEWAGLGMQRQLLAFSYQLSAFSLQPSAFSLQPSAFSLQPSALGHSPWFAWESRCLQWEIRNDWVSDFMGRQDERAQVAQSTPRMGPILA